MVEGRTVSCYHINNLPNFRVLYSRNGDKDDSRPSGLLYRSSRPDLLTDKDWKDFRRLGIRAVVDFRSSTEYDNASGCKLIDTEYSLCTVKIPHGNNYKPQDTVKYERIIGKGYEKEKVVDRQLDTVASKYGTSDSVSNGNVGDSCDERCYLTNGTTVKEHNHYLINFFTSRFVWTVFNRAPWYIKLYSSLVLLLSFILRIGYVHFFRIFATHIINPAGLAQQYKDIVDQSQRSICAALKLLSDPNNIPALINCAHGKDRTGIVTALIMSCMGNTREEILQEYGRSVAGLKSEYKRLYQEIVVNLHLSEPFLSADESLMSQLLDYITEKYGSVENYLEYIGFGPSEQAQLRRNLLCSDL